MQPIFAFMPHGTDFIWIFLIVILLFGANKLPQLAKGLGKSLGEFKKAKDEFEKEIHAATTSDDSAKRAVETPRLEGTAAASGLPATAAGTPTDELTKKS